MAIQAQTIVDAAESLLLDTGNVRWPAAELLGYLNEAQRVVSSLKPDSYAKITPIQLVAGTLQSIPADGTGLISVARNMGDDGLTVGAVITEASKELMDAALPGWHSETAKDAVIHWLFDSRTPKQFYVYPQQPASPNYVEIQYTAVPPNIAIGANISLGDEYEHSILNFILYRAFSKDTDTQNWQKANYYLQMALGHLGNKERVEAAVESVLGKKVRAIN